MSVLMVYMGGILSGSLAASISPGDVSLMVGASSGIYSLLTSHVSHICMVRHHQLFINNFYQLFLLTVFLDTSFSDSSDCIRCCAFVERCRLFNISLPCEWKQRTKNPHYRSHRWCFKRSSFRIYFLSN